MRSTILSFLLPVAAVASAASGCDEPSERAVEELAENRAEERAEALDVSESGEAAMEELAEERAEAVHESLEVIQGQRTPVPVESVLIQRRADSPDRMLFYREGVACAAVRDVPGDDRLVAWLELESELEAAPSAGALPVARWSFDLEARPVAATEDGAEVTVTRAASSRAFEGTVTLRGEADDETVTLAGPYTATICEMTVATR